MSDQGATDGSPTRDDMHELTVEDDFAGEGTGTTDPADLAQEGDDTAADAGSGLPSTTDVSGAGTDTGMTGTSDLE